MMDRAIDMHAICCNGDNCVAIAPAEDNPESSNTKKISQSTLGWLFVTRNAGEFYYCPKCAAKLLTNLYHRQAKPVLRRHVAAS